MKIVEDFAARRGFCGIGEPHGLRLLAIDPGLHTGWALFVKKAAGLDLVACGTGEPPSSAQPYPLWECVIECPQVYPQQAVPPNDLITLAFQAGRYAEAARVAKTRFVRTVLPHEWKGNLPKNVCAARVLSRLSPEEIGIVEEMSEGIPKSQRHNVLDAIGIGLFAWREDP
jgi:hypothetical protein